MLLSERKQDDCRRSIPQEVQSESMKACSKNELKLPAENWFYCLLTPLCILCTNNACVTGPCLQQHLRYVYVSHTPTRYVNEYVRQNATRAGQMKLVPTAFGPLVEHDDMVCLLYTMRHYVWLQCSSSLCVIYAWSKWLIDSRRFNY